MKLNIEINMDNAAFDECPELEITRIFNDLSKKFIRQGLVNRVILDANGSDVGQARFTNE